MATPIDPDFRAHLAALGDKYAAGVPALLDAIAQALARCRAEAPGADAAAALHKALHAVAGSAGTFGFGALGTQCRTLEHALRLLMEQPTIDVGMAAAAWPALAGQVDELLRRAAHDPKGLALPGASA